MRSNMVSNLIPMSKTHLKEYTLSVSYPEQVITVKKTYDSRNKDRLAKKWVANCLAICGKDALGRKYLSAVLTSSEIPVVQIVQTYP